MSNPIRPVRGTFDILPPDIGRWQVLEERVRNQLGRAGFSEWRTPILESTDLFKRSIGDTTDIVSKEMYTLTTESGESLTLRPEGTAAVVRALLSNRSGQLVEERICYMGPMFRHERPQKGRYRQFHQVGVEWFGREDAAADVELLTIAVDLLDALEIGETTLEVNSVGCSECRPTYRQALLDFLAPRQAQLCEHCQERYTRNPLRVLDCKNEGCRAIAADAPKITDHLCPTCDAHWKGVVHGLERAGIPFIANARLVRGLDYYTRTVFEFVSSQLGAQSTVLAGARYDGLVTQLGGPATPAVGFAAGIERLLLISSLDAPERVVDAIIIAVGEEPRAEGVRIARTLRGEGLTVMTAPDGSFKRQMKHADRVQAQMALILGEEELAAGEVTVKPMHGDVPQHRISIAELPFIMGSE